MNLINIMISDGNFRYIDYNQVEWEEVEGSFNAYIAICHTKNEGGKEMAADDINLPDMGKKYQSFWLSASAQDIIKAIDNLTNPFERIWALNAFTYVISNGEFESYFYPASTRMCTFTDHVFSTRLGNQIGSNKRLRGKLLSIIDKCRAEKAYTFRGFKRNLNKTYMFLQKAVINEELGAVNAKREASIIAAIKSASQADPLKPSFKSVCNIITEVAHSRFFYMFEPNTEFSKSLEVIVDAALTHRNTIVISSLLRNISHLISERLFRTSGREKVFQPVSKTVSFNYLHQLSVRIIKEVIENDIYGEDGDIVMHIESMQSDYNIFSLHPELGSQFTNKYMVGQCTRILDDSCVGAVVAAQVLASMNDISNRFSLSDGSRHNSKHDVHNALCRYAITRILDTPAMITADSLVATTILDKRYSNVIEFIYDMVKRNDLQGHPNYKTLTDSMRDIFLDSKKYTEDYCFKMIEAMCFKKSKIINEGLVYSICSFNRFGINNYRDFQLNKSWLRRGFNNMLTSALKEKPVEIRMSWFCAKEYKNYFDQTITDDNVVSVMELYTTLASNAMFDSDTIYINSAFEVTKKLLEFKTDKLDIRSTVTKLIATAMAASYEFSRSGDLERACSCRLICMLSNYDRSLIEKAIVTTILLYVAMEKKFEAKLIDSIMSLVGRNPGLGEHMDIVFGKEWMRSKISEYFKPSFESIIKLGRSGAKNLGPDTISKIDWYYKRGWIADEDYAQLLIALSL